MVIQLLGQGQSGMRTPVDIAEHRLAPPHDKAMEPLVADLQDIVAGPAVNDQVERPQTDTRRCGPDPPNRLVMAQTRSTVCTMAPKMVCPLASFISIRMVSSPIRNGVLAAPARMVSTVRSSARQE